MILKVKILKYGYKILKILVAIIKFVYSLINWYIITVL